MNDSIFMMIDKLKARLDDLSVVVKEVPYELDGYEKKLDRIDDQIYLIQAEIEKKLKSAVPLTQLSSQDSEAFDAATAKKEEGASEGKSNQQEKQAEAKNNTSSKDEGFLTDSAKETIADATKTLNSIYKEGKDVMGEFSEAFGDIAGVFGKKNRFKKH
jgi:Skp family chaperone for outer membrane proteins